MNLHPRSFGIHRLGKLSAAVVVGLGVGTMVPPETMTLPVVGAVSSLLVGGVGVVAGTAFYSTLSGSSDCDCSGDCGC